MNSQRIWFEAIGVNHDPFEAFLCCVVNHIRELWVQDGFSAIAQAQAYSNWDLVNYPFKTAEVHIPYFSFLPVAEPAIHVAVIRRLDGYTRENVEVPVQATLQTLHHTLSPNIFL
jgi:hypothetical protein